MSELGMTLAGYGFFVILIFVCGLFLVVTTKNLIRVLIGIELMTKAVTLLVLVVGKVTHRMDLAQSMILTIIFVEVVLVPVVAGLIFRIFQQKDSLDVGNVENLKG
jgi:NADH:ubiquinone oxidoreductase subunit K